jgi:hypothetical protein
MLNIRNSPKNTIHTLVILTLLGSTCFGRQLAEEKTEIYDPKVRAEVQAYHRQLEVKYNIKPPRKYLIPQNYEGIATMYGPKGLYVPSVPRAIALCYGVYIHPSGRVLPDPRYADETTLSNTSKALKRSYELAKLEYLAIKTYSQQIAQAKYLEENQ